MLAALDPAKVDPGIAGFLTVFFLGVATWLLIRSMVGHLRKVRYGPGPDGEGPDGADGGAGSVPTPENAATDSEAGTPAKPVGTGGKSAGGKSGTTKSASKGSSRPSSKSRPKR